MRSNQLRARIAAGLVAGLVAFGFASSASKAAAAPQHAPRIPLSAKLATNAAWSSSNWSGYAKSSSTYSSITGKWTVPSVSSTSSATYSSSWIGIDGFNNSNLIQTGTEQDYYSGRAHYSAWWEILPAPATTISLTIHAGDHMSASIKKGSNSMWTITISDTTSGHSFSTTKLYAGPQTSAEWIQEAPTVNGTQAKVAHYSTFPFDPGTVNGANPHLSSSNRGVMVQSGHQVSTPSSQDSDTDGFRMAYGATAPSPPSS